MKMFVSEKLPFQVMITNTNINLPYSSSLATKPGKLSDEQNACRFGSLNCEHGLDDTISIPKNITIKRTKDKKPNVCMMASSLLDGLTT
jgi:hypothetical protein